MVAWYVDEGLAKLIVQWKKEHPGSVVYTIGDASHLSRTSEHNPEPDGPLPGQDEGEVDAADFMIGHGVTEADLRGLADAIVGNRDPRVYYVIWKGRICSSHVVGGVPPWTWRKYSGSDHHDDHVHLSVDDEFDRNTSDWDLEDEMAARTLTWREFEVSMPEHRIGDEDGMWDGYNRITRAQAVLNTLDHTLPAIDPDGVYGAKTAQKLARVMANQAKKSSTDGKKLYEPEWRVLFGLGG